MIIGIDLGTFGVKTSTKTHFLSKISDVENFTNDNEIIYEGKKIFVGEGEFSTDWNKAKKENTLPLLFSAIAKSTNENMVKVVVGLPIQQYKKNKDQLKELIEKNRVKTITIGTESRTILITDVEVAPEGAAAYYALSKNIKDKIGNKQLIIVDVGGRTTDICLFTDKKISKVMTVPTGMLNVYQDIITHVNSTYTESYKLEYGEVILNEGLFLEGEDKDISFVKPILQKHFNSIYKELQLNFEVSKGYVLLTGGGSIKFRQAFKNRLNKSLIISTDPVYDNAIGYKRLGENIWQQS